MYENRSNGPIVALSAIGVLGILGAATAVLLVFAGPANAHHATTPTPTPSSATTPPVAPPTTPSHPSTPSGPSTVPVAPSASVEMLQRDLGQLNYYEGSVNGVMTSQTIQSIKYLQRDAGLPQTGQINAATSQALQRMLTDGNNQMAG